MKTRKSTLLSGIVFLIIVTNACMKEADISDLITEEFEITQWTAKTHGNDTDPDYDMVFPQDQVLRFDIVIDPENWNKIEEDMADNLTSLFFNRGPGGGGGMVDLTDYDPLWVPCSFNFNGIEWYQVGIRVKGNSSLQSTYQSGNNKFSFKLDFDEFEDDYEAIKNQRFYGFKQLNLNNNYEDASLMREKVASDLFREFGLVAPQTAFVELYIDKGNGSQYYGLYTLVEEVDDSVIDTQLGDESGNLYKPDGDAASFASGTFDESEMYLKNNEETADYSDVRSLYDDLHDESRYSDSESWKAELESILDINNFLKWLAANTTIQNWDTYGIMTHNFYLYNNHQNNKLLWIPWDNNEAFQAGKHGGALSLSMTEVGNDWPLIRYLLNEEEYASIYRAHLADFVTNVFTIDLQNTYSDWSQLIAPYAETEETGYTFLSSSGAFYNAVSTLQSHASQRISSVLSFLD